MTSLRTGDMKRQINLTTKTAVDALPFASGQTLYWDTSLRGFGVLVGKTTKTFIMQKDVRGRSRRITIGRHGDITVHLARKKAEVLAGEMRSGHDPVEERERVTADGMTLLAAWQLYQTYLTTKERSSRTVAFYW